LQLTLETRQELALNVATLPKRTVKVKQSFNVLLVASLPTQPLTRLATLLVGLL
jgi:hypothetical protein